MVIKTTKRNPVIVSDLHYSEPVKY